MTIMYIKDENTGDLIPLNLVASGSGYGLGVSIANDESKQLVATPTVSTSPAYASGDAIGGKLSFASAVNTEAGSGVIMSVAIADKAKQSQPIDVVFFTANPTGTTVTDNAALAIADADLLNIVGVVPINVWAAFNDNSLGYERGIGIPFKLTSGTTLYAILVSRGTPTFAATSDIQVTVGIIPD